MNSSHSSLSARRLTATMSDRLPESPTGRSSVSQPEALASSVYPERLQPIPTPSEPLQYRAIGLVWGRYQAGEHLTQGTLITSDGTQINAVFLGRMMSLLKKHLDLEVEHLWVVYPRTRENTEELHTQIVGVWEPQTLDASDSPVPEIHPWMGDGYFSIRGEVVFYSPETESVKIKIIQGPRKLGEKPRSFKLNLKGSLTGKILHSFWEFHVLRQGTDLVIQEALWMAAIAKPRSARPVSKRSFSRQDEPMAPRRGEMPKPVLSGSGASRSPVTPPPVIRRRKPALES